MSPDEYLRIARKKATSEGYDPSKLVFSEDGVHKLSYDGVKFGRVGYNDFILYTLKKDPKAAAHRKAYLARATKIKGDWKKSKTSPNSLAIAILW